MLHDARIRVGTHNTMSKDSYSNVRCWHVILYFTFLIFISFFSSSCSLTCSSQANLDDDNMMCLEKFPFFTSLHPPVHVRFAFFVSRRLYFRLLSPFCSRIWQHFFISSTGIRVYLWKSIKRNIINSKVTTRLSKKVWKFLWMKTFHHRLNFLRYFFSSKKKFFTFQFLSISVP